MNFVFPSIQSMELHQACLSGYVPPASNEDIQWAKNVKKRLQSDWGYMVRIHEEADRQLAMGNLRRFAWLTEGRSYIALWLSKWEISPVLGEIMRETPYKSELAVDILENYKPLHQPQRDILRYLIHTGRDTNTFNEGHVIEAAIRTGQNHVLSDLKTTIHYGNTAIEFGNTKAFAYLMNRHFKDRDRLDELLNDDRPNYKNLFAHFYREAARAGHIDILDILNDTASLAAEYRKCFKIALNAQENKAAEWFLKHGMSKAEAFTDCVTMEAFDFADKLIDEYDVDPNIDYCAALKACLEKDCFNGVEYLSRKNADMTRVAERIQNKTIAERTGFDKQLCKLFENAAIREQMINWTKEDSKTIKREHLTANYIHTTIFFFAEQQIAQYVTDIETNNRLNDKICGFDDFDNRALLQEAAKQIVRLGGDNDNSPVFSSGPKPVMKRR